MILKKQIPKDFYKLFRTKNRDAYMQFLVALYEENNEVYASLGLTTEECRAIIEDSIQRMGIVWEEEELEEEEEFDTLFSGMSPSGILNRLIRWGWLKSDFDEKLNTDVISFPEYSQLYAELFQKLQSEDDGKERESILSIYSALFTYHSDTEKNNDILKSALRTSKNLGQLLSNMQDGMRSYFDELSSQKNFIGIQEVLVEEINNSDSRKYAILTTTDSFYRYKEAVKELISQILNENETKRDGLMREKQQLEVGSLAARRLQYSLEYCEDASRIVYRVEREFDLVERKYNKLIEQKTIFAKRALARIHYILQEGAGAEDSTLELIGLLNNSGKKNALLEDFRDSLYVTAPFSIVGDDSLYNRRQRQENEFVPLALQEEASSEIADFVPKPLYTGKQLQEFRRQHTKDGIFQVSADTVQSAEDLEKLLFIWQEATQSRQEEDRILLQEEIHQKDGFSYTGFSIDETEN